MMPEEKKKISLDDKIINWVSANLLCSFLIVLLIITVMIVSIFGITALIYKNKTVLNPNEIGDSIGGITAPVIGLFSALLVYIAFREQKRANDNYEKNLLIQNEVGFIQNRIDYIENYINEYEFHYIKNEQVVTIKGIAAIYEVGRNTEKDIYNFEAESSFYQYGVRISYILSQFKKIATRVNNSIFLNEKDKENFKVILFDYWNDILNPPIDRLLDNHSKEFSTRGVYNEIKEYQSNIDAELKS